MEKSAEGKILTPAVVIAALGYFVDIYDLVLFSIVRVPSLKGLGFEGQPLFDKSIFLLNVQMSGLLLGGILWGVLGDKRGRLTVMLSSIFLYSISNIANGLVHSVEAYAFWRFVAGVGLAGELGAGITLVSEVLHRERRGVGTTIVAGVGVSGAIVAGALAEILDWRVCYIVGGVLGLALLAVRIRVSESGMFDSVSKSAVNRGDFFSLFKRWSLFRRYACSILIGVPIWHVIGILITFSPEIMSARGLDVPISGGRAILFSYLGLTIGDFASGLLSQRLKSRRKAVAIFLVITFLAGCVYFVAPVRTEAEVYGICVLLGIGVGYWAVFVTIAAEQFGTNLRATVATTTPNFVRGAVVPLTIGFTAIKAQSGVLSAAIILGLVVTGIAFIALWNLRETYGRDLDFVETD